MIGRMFRYQRVLLIFGVVRDLAIGRHWKLLKQEPVDAVIWSGQDEV